MISFIKWMIYFRQPPYDQLEPVRFLQMLRSRSQQRWAATLRVPHAAPRYLGPWAGGVGQIRLENPRVNGGNPREKHSWHFP